MELAEFFSGFDGSAYGLGWSGFMAEEYLPYKNYHPSGPNEH